MKCANCGIEGAISGPRSIARTYKSESIVFHDIECIYCNYCGETTLGVTEGEHLFKLMRDFMKKIDSQLPENNR
uniref:type II toxin-antitoxin system MqsA family antitoxin n=1 Tax=Herbaspirillum sp. DW155 TaxID=3095609 RepID=UPI00403F7D5B